MAAPEEILRKGGSSDSGVASLKKSSLFLILPSNHNCSYDFIINFMFKFLLNN